jgi:hypothetical protein
MKESKRQEKVTQKDTGPLNPLAIASAEEEESSTRRKEALTVLPSKI